MGAQKITEQAKKKLRIMGSKSSYCFDQFTRWIKREAQRLGVKKVYFLTREGEFFQKLYDKVASEDCPSCLLEVSRLSTVLPSLRDASIDSLSTIFAQYPSMSLKTLCYLLKIEVASIDKVAMNCGLTITEEINDIAKDPRFQELVKSSIWKRKVTESIDRERILLQEYLSDRGITHSTEKVMLVDIGWHGTMEDSLARMYPYTKFYGYYMGLLPYKIPQASNAFKYGFINHFVSEERLLSYVKVFEMSTNSASGSTLGYHRVDGKICAIRKIDEKENESYDYGSRYFQEGVLEKMKPKSDLSFDPKLLLSSFKCFLIYPAPQLGKQYLLLHHNEEFGKGSFETVDATFHYWWLPLAIVHRKTRNKLHHLLQSSGWTHGFLAAKHLGFLNYYWGRKFKEDEMMASAKRIAWFMPSPIKGSGGHRTIVQNANALIRAGYRCDIYVEDDKEHNDASMRQHLIDYFDECLASVYLGSDLKQNYDLLFATHAIKTPEYVEYAPCEKKAYFVQDFEPWFLPMGELYLQMERSYDYGFQGISIGKFLAHRLSKDYGMAMRSFPFCADLSVYHVDPTVKREKAICFVYQPEKPRRCPNLGRKALEIVKKLRPDVTIYLYGSTEEAPKDLECKHLGLISIEECNKLYQKCQVGLCISASNPSRIPFEMMASGLPVVDLYRENNLYDFPDEGALLADPTPESIATALIKLIDDPERAIQMGSFGAHYMKNYDLSVGFRDFVEAVDRLFALQFEEDTKVEKSYHHPRIKPSEEVLELSLKEEIWKK